MKREEFDEEIEPIKTELTEVKHKQYFQDERAEQLKEKEAGLE